MPTNILMPALSPTMEKGNLAKWLKKEGDTIKAGDIIAEIETDKATMEVEAVDEGTLAKIVVPEGTSDVPVNDVIGLIAAEGEDAKSVVRRRGASRRNRQPAPATRGQRGQAAARSPATAGCRGGRRRRRNGLPPRPRQEPGKEPTTVPASSPRPWPSGSPRRPGSISAL